MTEAVERLGNLRSFLNAWDDPQHWQNRREVPLRTTPCGNINATGEVGDYSGHAVTQWQGQFDTSLEPGVRSLVRALVDDWRWITFTSCEGHSYPNSRLPSVPRHVGLLPRNQSEELHMQSVLKRARERLSALPGPTSVRISVTCRSLEDPTVDANARNAVFLTFDSRPDAPGSAEQVDQVTRRFVEGLTALPDRIDYDAVRDALLREFGARAAPAHWSRVERLGLRIAQDTDADITVVRLFSMFHDNCRVGEGHVRNEGDRAVELARRLLPGFCSTHPRRVQLLQEACRNDSEGTITDDPTVGTCWDADRLDLVPPGIASSDFFNTAAARTDELQFADRPGQHADPRRAPGDAASFFSPDAVYHMSADPEIHVFVPRAYWHVNWSISGPVPEGKVPSGATIFDCVYASSINDVPFYVCPPRIRRIRLDVQRAHGKVDIVQRLLHGVQGQRLMIFDSEDRAALERHECRIYRFPKTDFELFPNGEYGSSRAVVPEATLHCSDWMSLLNDFGYQIMLLDDLERAVRTLLFEGIPFESEGFEDMVMEYRQVDVSESSATRLHSAISEVRELTPGELTSPRTLSAIIRRAGLTYDERDVYGRRDAVFMVRPPGGLYQSPRQLADLLVYLSRRNVTSAVEIGAGAGWTTVMMAAYLERFNPNVRCLGIDVDDTFAVELDMLDSVPCELRTATSAELRSTPFDFCLIDGDHSYDAVMTDFENVGRQSGTCALHDIHDEWCPGVRRAWHELRERYSNREFRGDLAHLPRMGIGVLELHGTNGSDTSNS
jgi:uncharacterized protein